MARSQMTKVSRSARGGEVRLAEPVVEREAVGELAHLVADAGESGLVTALVESFGDPTGDGAHLCISHTPCRKSRCADANAAGLHGRIGVEGDGVFIHR